MGQGQGRRSRSRGDLRKSKRRHASIEQRDPGRRRTTHISRRNTARDVDPKAVEEFAAAAAENTVAAPEAATAPAARPDLPRHRQRAKTGTKGPGTSFRYNKSQGRLLDYAVEMEDMKKQE